MRVAVGPTGVVRCVAEVPLPLTVGQAWGQLRDFRTYAATDRFHADPRVEGDRPWAGAGLTMLHRLGPFRLTRVGRVLRWRELPHDVPGFAFSDLSRRGVGVGFPHVLSMALRPASDGCVLTIRVGGRWTSPVPRPLARLWLAWIFAHVVRTTERRLLAHALWLRRRGGEGREVR